MGAEHVGFWAYGFFTCSWISWHWRALLGYEEWGGDGVAVLLSLGAGGVEIERASVRFSHSVVSDSLRPHGLYHTRVPCPSPTPGACSNLTSIESVIPSNHLIFCHPCLLLPSIFPSIRVFFSESVLHIRWPKYWSFSFSSSPSNEYSGLISFRIDWFDLLAVQGALKSLLQHHSSERAWGPVVEGFRFLYIQHRMVPAGAVCRCR